MDFLSTVKGSLLENFYPEGWDFEKIDACCEKALQKNLFGIRILRRWNAAIFMNLTPLWGMKLH